MGLSASQARFLMLTAKKSDLEYQAQQIAYKRTVLANNTATMQGEYNDKMNNTVLAFASRNTGGYSVLTYDAFTKEDNFAGMYLTNITGKKVVAGPDYIPEGEDPDDYEIDERLLRQKFFEDCLKEGIYYISQDGDEEGKVQQKSIAEITAIHEIYDVADDAAAEADYDIKMKQIQKDDKKLEMELNSIETQHKAIETELESIQKVIDKDIENGFKTFS